MNFLLSLRGSVVGLFSEQGRVRGKDAVDFVGLLSNSDELGTNSKLCSVQCKRFQGNFQKKFVTKKVRYIENAGPNRTYRSFYRGLGVERSVIYGVRYMDV